MEGRVPTGVLREHLSDFIVTEVLDCDFTDSGEHLYLEVEKSNLNTQDVQKVLAGHYGVAHVDVSYSGLKDKRAITRQWFSVRLPKSTTTPTHSNFIVLSERMHSHKLRKGTHEANKFEIVLRHTSVDSRELAKQAFSKPFPNYFGSQRFGRNFNNLRRARDWVMQERPRIARNERSRHLSTLRSFVFNEVLARRVKDGTWNSPIDGDCLSTDVPTGPLWGRGQLQTAKDARVVEESVSSCHEQICDALEWVGLRQERRELAVQPSHVQIDGTASTVSLSFSLPPGSYATVALNECFEVGEMQW